MGIGQESFLGQEPEMYTYEKGSVQLLKRNAAGNKGTFGKALLVAGSNGMAGAAILAAKAAYRTGAGMVKVITAEENRQIIQQGFRKHCTAPADSWRRVWTGRMSSP